MSGGGRRPPAVQPDLFGAGYAREVGGRPTDDFLQTPRRFIVETLEAADDGSAIGLLDRLDGDPVRILDLCAGLGVLGRAADEYFTRRGSGTAVTAVERNADRLATLPATWTRVEADGLAWAALTAEEGQRWDLVLMNPPFAYPPPAGRKKPVPMWGRFVDAALPLRAEDGIALILAKVDFLFGKGRASRLYRPVRPSRIFAAVSRQDYENGMDSGAGTDFESIFVQWGPELDVSVTEWTWLWDC